jgi:RecB family exonuclease
VIESIAPPIGSAIVTYSDPDDEVRGVVRGILGAMRAGVPAERIAVLYASDEPYARLLHEHLDGAGVVHNGASVRTLAESVLGRALLQFLALGDDRFRRDHLFAFLASAPVLDGSKRVPAADWERLSRDAGVVGGLEEWDERLARYGDDLDTESGWGAREHARAEALRAFVADLARDLERGQRARSWSALCGWASGAVRRWLGDERRREHDQWPPFEQEAARRVERALDRLSGLDSVDAAPSFDVFRRTLELELRSATERLGRLGEGVLVGGVGLALGVEIDELFVCGLAEGVFPSVPRDDPLLSDSERGVLDGDLRLRRERVHDLHRGLLAAFASTIGSRTCSVPRGDLRRSTEHVFSRFLTATREHDADARPPTVVASYVQGLARAAFPATEHELAVRAATLDESWVRSLRPVDLGLELSRARASAEFTRFDGNLAGLADRLRRWSPATDGVVVSASRLQAWATCPHAYFLSCVLGVEPVARPEEIEQLSPLDRGSLMHRALDRFIDEVAAHEGAGRPWSAEDRERLRAITEEECDAVEAHGLVGRRLLWQRDRSVILAELDAFLTADEAFREAQAAHTLATELTFGGRHGDYDPVDIPLSDGRSLRVRGAIDRVDRFGDGRLFVIDYKTGSDDDYKALVRDDPVLAGTCLQLPIYAAAARSVFDAGDVPVEAAYWFVGRGNNRRIGYVVDDTIDARFDEVLRLIVDGIEAGCFVANPPTPGPKFYVECDYCDPDHRGTGERWRESQRKAAAAGLAAFRALRADGEEDS